MKKETKADVLTREELEAQILELTEQVTEMEETLYSLESRLCKAKIKMDGRKDQVLAILKKEGHITVESIAKRIGITSRNVSSQLTYLRKDGYSIATDSLGRKFLESTTPMSVAVNQ